MYGITLLGPRTCITVLVYQAANSNTMQQFLKKRNCCGTLCHEKSPGNFPKKPSVVITTTKMPSANHIVINGALLVHHVYQSISFFITSNVRNMIASSWVGRRNCASNKNRIEEKKDFTDAWQKTATCEIYGGKLIGYANSLSLMEGFPKQKLLPYY